MYAANDVTVRFKFKDQTKIYGGVMTAEQYENLKALPAIEFCEKVNKLGKKVTKEAEQLLQKRFDQVFRNDSSHVRNLSYA